VGEGHAQKKDRLCRDYQRPGGEKGKKKKEKEALFSCDATSADQEKKLSTVDKITKEELVEDSREIRHGGRGGERKLTRGKESSNA